MTTPAPTIPRIFVSHSHHDNGFCRPFVAHLRATLGVSPDHVFYDETALHLGDVFLERIQREVVARPIFLVILSPHSVEADYVRAETTLALQETITHRERRFLSLLVEPCDPRVLAPMVTSYQMANMVKRGYDAAFAELVEAIRAAASGKPSVGADLLPPMSPAPHSTPQDARARQLAEEAQAALQARRWGEASAKVNFVLTLPQNHANAVLFGGLALACAEAGQWEPARDVAKRVLDGDPFRVDLWRVLARAEAALSHPDAALAALDRARALTSDADLPGLLSERRGLLIVQQRWADALAVLDEELALAPGDPQRLGIRLELLRRAGRDPEALALARELTPRPGASAAVWLARAQLARSVAHDTREVRAALDAADRLAPGDSALARARDVLLPPPIPPERFPKRLAALGFEPRKVDGVEVIVPPLRDVPAGAFPMGSDPKRDKDAQSNERPQRPVNVGAFRIGTYPVTVAEYACFVRAGRKQPGNWTGQLSTLDHPVVCVSWNDAVGYAIWLTKMTGQEWRLASEAEWEKAARGTDGRIYPWGDAFEVTNCNTRASGIGTTTPVGTYPSGASPYGAQDMAGNVWEWTGSLYKPFPYVASDGRKSRDSAGIRVLRGGSWGNAPLLARVACRLTDLPALTDVDNGFRVVVVASPGS
jgi:formylglycine-generating enzyme required for sulfatase activity